MNRIMAVSTLVLILPILVASVEGERVGTGSTDDAWHSLDSGGNASNVTVTWKVSPEGDPGGSWTVEVKNAAGSTIGTYTSPGNASLGPNTHTAQKICVNYPTGKTYKIEVEVSGSTNKVRSTWLTTTGSGVTLWEREAVDDLTFVVEVDSGEDDVTVQAYNGTTQLEEWTATADKAVVASISATKIVLLAADSSGAFTHEKW